MASMEGSLDCSSMMSGTRSDDIRHAGHAKNGTEAHLMSMSAQVFDFPDICSMV